MSLALNNWSLKDCLWKQRTHKRTKIGDLVLLSLETLGGSLATHKAPDQTVLIHRRSDSSLDAHVIAAFQASILFKPIKNTHQPDRNPIGRKTARYRFK